MVTDTSRLKKRSAKLLHRAELEYLVHENCGAPGVTIEQNADNFYLRHKLLGKNSLMLCEIYHWQHCNGH